MVLGLLTRFLILLVTVVGSAPWLLAAQSGKSPQGSHPLRLCVERVSALVHPLAPDELDQMTSKLSVPGHMSETELRSIYARLIELITKHEEYYEDGQFLMQSERGKKIKAAMRAFLIEAAERSGEVFEVIEEDRLDETSVPVVRFLPSASRFGKYIKFLQERFGGEVVYSPFDSRPNISASFDLYDNRIFISHDNFLSRPIDDVMAHETQHMAIASDLREGKNSIFHSRIRRGLGLGRTGYQDHLALDELSAYANDVRRGLLQYPIYSQSDVSFSQRYLERLATSFQKTVGQFASRLDEATTLAPDKIQWSTQTVPPRGNKPMVRSVELETNNLYVRFDFKEIDGANHLIITAREYNSAKELDLLIRGQEGMREKPRSPVFETVLQDSEVDRLTKILAKGELTPELKEDLVLGLRNHFNAVLTIADEAIRFGAMAELFQRIPAFVNGRVPQIPASLSYSRQSELEKVLRALDDVGSSEEPMNASP